MNNPEDLTIDQELEEIDRLNNLAYDTYAEEQAMLKMEEPHEIAVQTIG